jgi:uncharacterized protein YbjT (DUF2867 family)
MELTVRASGNGMSDLRREPLAAARSTSRVLILTTVDLDESAVPVTSLASSGSTPQPRNHVGATDRRNNWEGSTMQTEGKIAVAGATGRVGHHLVEVLTARGHEVVPISRTHGVDIINGEGLAEALVGVECIVDTATGPSPEQQAATEFFTTATKNLQTAGQRAGVQRIIVLSIINTDRLKGGYSIAKAIHEREMLSAPIHARVLRAAQFHEFVDQLVQWGTQGQVAYVPKMRTQLVAARTVAESLADLAVDPTSVPGPTLEVAGPREESLVEIAKLLVARRGNSLQVEGVSDPVDGDANESGVLLPGTDAHLGGPTFEEWLETQFPSTAGAGK